jgi:hypothetical protein
LWDKKLTEIIVAYLQTKPMSSAPEKYSTFGLRGEMRDWDTYFAAEIPKIGVIYISAYDVLCNEKGCLTHLGPKPTDLTAVDTGHLTPAAAKYLIQRVGDRIVAAFEKTGP